MVFPDLEESVLGLGQMQMPFSFFRKNSTSFYGRESDAAPHSYPHPHADLKLNAGLRKDIILTSTLTSVFRLLSIDLKILQSSQYPL